MRTRRARLHEGSVNNPKRMRFDDLVVYLDNLSDANATLINTVRITDAYEGDVQSIQAGTTVYDALVLLGEIEPEIEPEQEEEKWVDDPWAINGPWHERELEGYDCDETLLLDLMKSVDGTIDGEDPDEWMNNTDYDLYIDIPMNIRRPDGKPFDRHDVGKHGQVNAWFARSYKHISHARKYGGIVVYPDRFSEGDMSVDCTWEFR